MLLATDPRMKQPKAFFSESELSALDTAKTPHHIAFIPDGNRRWAKRNQETPKTGHSEGADILMDILRAGKQIGVKVMTFYLFSTENWNRSQEEVDALMWLLPTYLIEQRQTMIDEDIRLETIGDLSRFSPGVIQVINDVKAATAHCKSLEFVMALNYGSRDEMKRAFQKMAWDIENKKICIDDITSDLISQYLDTRFWKDPDMLIRTSGEMRVSNFLLWQISYAEVYIEEVLWPDFTPRHLLNAVISYQKRDRRLGGP